MKILYSIHNTATIPHEISHHFMPYCELTLVIGGHMDYYVDGVPTAVNEGEAIFISSNRFRSRKVTNTACNYISFNFETQNEINLPTCIKNAVNSESLLIINLFDIITANFYTDNNEKIAHLLSCLVLLLEDRVKTEKFSQLTQKIISYINKNLSAKITLADISEMTHFSTVYCDTVFGNEVGQPIIDFLISRRIEQAKKLLMDQTIPLQKLSALVGFEDYNYFSRVFKRRVGISPSTYRKIMHNV